MAGALKEWSVGLEASTERGSIEAEQLFELVERLGAHHAGAVSLTRDGTGVGVTLWIEASDLKRAVAAGERALLGALQSLGLGGLAIVGAEVKLWTDAERELERSNVPELAGVAELAEVLGVSRQRVSELAATRSFPRPLAQLRSGPVWDLAAIGNFMATWRRAPGRPPALRRPDVRTSIPPGAETATGGGSL